MVAVISNAGIRLMPTSNFKARKLLKSGRAEIYRHRPFAIRILDRKDGDIQPIEFKQDTGYMHIGISVCSEKHEYVSEQRDLLSDEPEHHKDHLKLRRTRRNRLRHRKPRFDNRKGLISKEGFAPSIRNKRNIHVSLFRMYHEVMPITKATIEMGQFDTQLLKAIAEGRPLPEGTDYQHGERYGITTLREAVFTRDNYRCVFCGRTPFKHGAILHVHHVGFWKGDRTNRLANLAAVCEKCHTSKNHKPGGMLYGKEPKLKNMASATFMTMVRYSMFRMYKKAAPDTEFHMTYGAMTKLKRKDTHVKKSHANDAYAMGLFHPKHRCDTLFFKKVRRNNRILEKFYDAKIIDIRTGAKVKGAQLGCERTKRNIPRNNSGNLRPYRGQKISSGKRSIRYQRYRIQPGDRVLIKGQWYTTSGMHNKGTRLMVNKKSYSVKEISSVIHTNGWIKVEQI